MDAPRSLAVAGGRAAVTAPRVVQTKLRPPRPFRPLIRRGQLERRLDEAVTHATLVLLQAPAGTGKTSLLTRWAAGRAVAWLNLDARDNDAGRFWSHVSAALASAVGDPTLAGTTEDAPIGSELFVGELVERLGRVDDRPVLVLDEYEQLTNDGIHEQVDLLVRGCTDRLTTVIASRTHVPLRLDQLALSGRLVVLSWSDLRMDADEAGRLFGEVFDLHPSRERTDALLRATDGWAGGLALIGARLRVTGATVDDDLPVDRELLADHLVDQVWGLLATDLREFLLDTSVLDRFCVPLAQAVHPAGDAVSLIERLRTDGVFLLREDDRAWFRYQRLFRWALARHLPALDPRRARRAHAAAARWHAVEGSLEDAIDHALLARDHRLAGQLIEQRFDSYAADGRLLTLARWLDAFPDAAIATASGRLIDRSLDLWCSLGRPYERDRWRAAAGRALPSGGPARAADVWQLCLPRERGDLARALLQGTAVLRSEGAWASPIIATQARISMARSLLLAGRPTESQRVLAEVPGFWGDAELPAPLLAVSGALLGLALHREGDLDGARQRAAETARALAACQSPPSARAMPEAAILAAALLGTDGDPAPLARLAALVDGSPGLGPDRSMAAFAQLVLARSLLARGDRQAAAARVAAADADLASFPSPLGLTDLRDEVAALAGAAPSSPRATELLSERELTVLHYLRSDLSFQEIATHLYVSVNTIKTHARHVYRKLGVSGRRELVPSQGEASVEAFSTA